MMNVVEIRQGDGTYITSLEPELLVENLEVIFSLNPTTVIEVFEFQMLFEPIVARLAAIKATDQDIKLLEDAFKMAKNNKDDLEVFINNMIIIRNRLHTICGNAIVSQISKVVSNIFEISSKKHGAVVGVSENALIKLSLAIQSIKNRDEEGAYKFMRERYEILFDEFIANSKEVTG